MKVKPALLGVCINKIIYPNSEPTPTTSSYVPDALAEYFGISCPHHPPDLSALTAYQRASPLTAIPRAIAHSPPPPHARRAPAGARIYPRDTRSRSFGACVCARLLFRGVRRNLQLDMKQLFEVPRNLTFFLQILCIFSIGKLFNELITTGKPL